MPEETWSRAAARKGYTHTSRGQRERGASQRQKAKTPALLRAFLLSFWLREKDLNLRPLGYEPNELPDCSIAR